MAMWKWIVCASIIIAGLAYILYEPLPEGLDQKLTIRIQLAFLKMTYYLSSASSYMGYSKGTVYRNMLETLASLQPATNLGSSITTKDTIFDGVKVRLYTPKLTDDSSLKRGLVYYHGGGWVVGGLDFSHHIIYRIAKDLDAVVASVDYRMAPEHVYPAAIDDCEKATLHFIQHAGKFGVDVNRVAVIGDSAGGNLAASVSIRLRDKQLQYKEKHIIQPKLQVLINPVTQFMDFNTPSYIANADGPLQTKEGMTFFASTYLFGNDWYKYEPLFAKNDHTPSSIKKAYFKSHLNIKALPNDSFLKNYQALLHNGEETLWKKIEEKILDSSVSPLLEDSHAGLPSAYIITCQVDVLRDDGFFYAKRLRDAGVKVFHEDFKNAFHGWLLFYNDIKQFDELFGKMTDYIHANL